jgi:hypothetical protein
MVVQQISTDHDGDTRYFPYYVCCIEYGVRTNYFLQEMRKKWLMAAVRIIHCSVGVYGGIYLLII